MIVAFKNNGCGKAEVFIDGVKAEFKAGDKMSTVLDGGTSNWNNVSTILLFNEEVSAKHKIEIRMAEGDEEKPFTICGFGYSK